MLKLEFTRMFNSIEILQNIQDLFTAKQMLCQMLCGIERKDSSPATSGFVVVTLTWADN